MGIYLDSADPDDVRRVQALGFIEGITTNPALIARTGRPGLEILAELVEIFDGHIFYQLTGDSVEARFDQAWEAHEVHPGKVVIKIPATLENIGMTAGLVDAGIECALTAVVTPAQAYLGAQANASFVIPYVNRLTRQLGDGLAIVREIVSILSGTETQVLAASLKTADEATQALLAGAHHVTVPRDVLEAMGEHALSQQAITGFQTKPDA